MDKVIICLILVVCFIASIYGWVVNLVKLSCMDVFDSETAIRIVGAFLYPVGSVMGYL